MRHMKSIKGILFTLMPFFLVACKTPDDTAILQIAVATNFERAMSALESEFEAQSGYALNISYGASGKLYAQIQSGAPFDVFLSADQARIKALSNRTTHQPFTYAYGKLVLWAKDTDLSEDPRQVLKTGDYRRLALANPDLAPYGLAAMQVLSKLGLKDSLKDKIVTGENVGQAYALVATRNAELGFIAASFIYDSNRYNSKDFTDFKNSKGSFWEIPQTLYDPIAQDAVQLTNSPAAQAFVNYLQSEAAKTIINAKGYGRS